MRQIQDTKFYSKKIGDLPKGCQMCVKGEKLVLYITGICPRSCWYCPLSDRRKDKDVIFINEWETSSLQDLKKEIDLCQSKGCGITGGDPLARLSRTIEYIQFMKQNFTKKFHIHLYTSFDLVTKENLQQLHKAGLDEIRFHADLDDDKLWNKIDIANEFDWDIGIEIPCIPNKLKEIKKLCDYMDKKIKFMNLNEFEISDLNSEEMYKHGFKEKTDISHGIKGSEQIGIEIMNYCKNKSFNLHFCTGTLKDKVQMQNRFKLRAQSIKTKFDIITDEGLLLRGIIYLKNKEKNIDKLKQKKQFLEQEGLELILDKQKFRLITFPEHVEQFKDTLKELNLIPAIVEEDPTVESFIVDEELL